MVCRYNVSWVKIKNKYKIANMNNNGCAFSVFAQLGDDDSAVLLPVVLFGGAIMKQTDLVNSTWPEAGLR